MLDTLPPDSPVGGLTMTTVSASTANQRYNPNDE